MSSEKHPVILTTFTDPMMGLSYECEPIFRKLETHFPEAITFRYVMSLLVRDVYELVDPQDLPLGRETAVQRYNRRLSKIYESEESISGMPICMNDFRLFSTENTSSLPLNLAYQAARLSAPELADLFLYNLRYATIVECRPTTRTEELLAVAEKTGLPIPTFLKFYQDGSAQAALEQDLAMGRTLGIRTLPAYLVQYRDNTVLIRSLIGYNAFVSVIDQLTGGEIESQDVAPSPSALRRLLVAHPLISPIEVREALDLHSTEEVRELLQPLLDAGEAEIRTVEHGWFIRRVSQ